MFPIQGGQILHLATKELEDAFEWNITGNMVFSLDNEGYFFNRDQHWFTQECAFQDNQFVLSHHKYFLLSSQTNNFMLFKKIGPRTDERFLDWSRFCGFIYYDYMHLFNNHSVYVFEDSREYSKAGFEYFLGYRKHTYKQFFRCKRVPTSHIEHQDDQYPYEHCNNTIDHSNFNIL